MTDGELVSVTVLDDVLDNVRDSGRDGIETVVRTNMWIGLVWNRRWSVQDELGEAIGRLDE